MKFYVWTCVWTCVWTGIFNEKAKIIQETNNRIDEMILAYRILERKCTKTKYQFNND